MKRRNFVKRWKLNGSIWRSVPSAWILFRQNREFRLRLSPPGLCPDCRQLKSFKTVQMAAELEENSFHAEIVTPGTRDGFTRMASWLANVLTACDHFHVQTGTKGSNYRCSRPIWARWDAIRYVSAGIAIGHRCFNLSTRIKTKQLGDPRVGEAGRSIRHSLFCRTFNILLPIEYYYCCNATLGRVPQTTCDTLGLAISVNSRLSRVIYLWRAPTR
jgi:hypothetical protein